MNIFSIVIGFFTLIVVLVGLVPLLGWLEWLALVMGLIGTAIGAMGKSKGGMIFNIVLMAVAGFRLFIGGGLL